MIARIPPGSLGAYVITMASRASDVLAVELLQKVSGVAAPLRVVPLFETSRDLENAGAILDTLLPIPWYRERINGRQEVMVGYSDSAKDVGRLAAGWDLYRAQEEIVAAVPAPRYRGDAVPWPRRQRRPRRRTDAPGDHVAARRIDRRHAARHRAGRDAAGAVRPARYRAADARGLHQRHARSVALAGAAAAPRVARLHGSLCATPPAPAIARSSTSIRASSSTSTRPRRKRSSREMNIGSRPGAPHGRRSPMSGVKACARFRGSSRGPRRA